MFLSIMPAEALDSNPRPSRSRPGLICDRYDYLVPQAGTVEVVNVMELSDYHFCCVQCLMK